MKKFIIKHSSLIVAIAMMLTTSIASANCAFVYHQPKIPGSARKLRKF